MAAWPWVLDLGSRVRRHGSWILILGYVMKTGELSEKIILRKKQNKKQQQQQQQNTSDKIKKIRNVFKHNTNYNFSYPFISNFTVLIFTDNLQKLRFEQCSSNIMNDNMSRMFCTNNKLLKRKTVLKLHYFKFLISADSCEA